ncbi:SCO1/SenC family transporter protein [Legionella quinlivanii]|uniref:SCO1/SenC family transporter protein n=1 Tax=Legionella quinlivanii TaxID=45073 RepID=A0A0W0XM33_9GAMM|nr:SCO family protein [Legionella quinlivanii]KTD45410.1 SCO1/SenC family transporter protein [Legionella quinlivanii]MCW8451302.1 SCO family protein [Legionella quinlivanii]SEG34295.1 protein SCO1/2 [Legionella quinlivanii DSM 21216]STY10501.1 SCO1/SenC family protein [Legionella quinlivanii]
MASQNKKITLTVTVLLAIAAMFTGLFVAQHMHWNKEIDPSQFHGTLLQKPRDIEQFSLTGVDEKSFDNKSLQGQWTMIFFGFTNCGYVCPTTMAELAKMYSILEEQRVKPLPHVVMISVDPERDDLEKLKNYVIAFNPHFYGARGEQATVKKMAMEMGIAYEKKISTNSENYDVQHSGAVMLFNPQGELSAFFTTPHRADLLAKDYQLLVG